MRRLGPIALALGSAAMFVAARPAPVRAADPAISVRARECGELDTNAISLVLELELEDMAGSWEELAAPPVSLECTGERLRIAVDDPVTGKRLERAIPEPGSTGEGRERAIALAVSQLFLTSWLELLLPRDQRFPLPERPEAEVQAATDRARQAVAHATPERPAPPPARPRGRVSLSGGARLRDPRHALVTLVGGVRVGLELDARWHLFAQAGYEQGEASRGRGTVGLRAGDFGVGAGVRVPLSDRWALEARAVFSAIYLRLEGEPAQRGVRGSSASSSATQAALEAGPSFDLGRLRLELSLSAGATLFGVEGSVEDEPRVTANGPFFSAQLAASTIL